MRREQSGYDPAPGKERWVADTLAAMESVAGGTEDGAAPPGAEE